MPHNSQLYPSIYNVDGVLECNSFSYCCEGEKLNLVSLFRSLLLEFASLSSAKHNFGGVKLLMRVYTPTYEVV